VGTDKEMQAAFETYAINMGKRDFEQNEFGDYRNPFTQEPWNYWRAALQALLSSSKPAVAQSFEAWAMEEGLIGESHGVRFVNSMCDVAQKAWNAALAASPAALTWSKEPPTKQGLYWHWTGDLDTGPIPLCVLWSGTKKKCFVPIGQYGIKQPFDCDKYGGYWMPLQEPAMDELIGYHGSNA
jgi:hypothetical protein